MNSMVDRPVTMSHLQKDSTSEKSMGISVKANRPISQGMMKP